MSRDILRLRIYLIIETAKANGLNPMKYIQFILSDMPGITLFGYSEFLEDYMPWNPMIQQRCK